MRESLFEGTSGIKGRNKKFPIKRTEKREMVEEETGT